QRKLLGRLVVVEQVAETPPANELFEHPFVILLGQSHGDQLPDHVRLDPLARRARQEIVHVPDKTQREQALPPKALLLCGVHREEPTAEGGEYDSTLWRVYKIDELCRLHHRNHLVEASARVGRDPEQVLPPSAQVEVLEQADDLA